MGVEIQVGGSWKEAVIISPLLAVLAFYTKQTQVALPLAMAAFLTIGGNRFNTLNLTLWVLAILFTCLAFWQGELPFRGWWMWLKGHLTLPWKLSISSWTLLVLAVVALHGLM